MRRANRNPNSAIYVLRSSPTNVALNFKGHAGDEFEAYADAYTRSAQTLVTENFAEGTRHDLDVLPIAFLYRHAAELYLKSILRRGASLAELNGSKKIDYRTKSHSLVALLRAVKPVFAMMRWTWDAKTDGLRSFADFEKFFVDLEADPLLGIDDKRSDLWRYPVNRKNADHLPAHFSFDVMQFSREMDKVLALLEGASMELGEQLEAMHEYLSELAAEYAENGDELE